MTIYDPDPVDLDELRRLAQACDRGAPRWYDWQRLGKDRGVTDPADAALITAMTPERVLSLLDQIAQLQHRLDTLRHIAVTVAPAVKVALGGEQE